MLCQLGRWLNRPPSFGKLRTNDLLIYLPLSTTGRVWGLSISHKPASLSNSLQFLKITLLSLTL